MRRCGTCPAFLAAGTILQIAVQCGVAPGLAAVLLVAAVGGIELHQYWRIFVQHDIGEPVTQALMYGVGIVRPAL